MEAEINPVLVGADSVVPTDCLVREVVRQPQEADMQAADMQVEEAMR